MAKLLTKIGKQKLLVASPLNPLTIKSVAIGTGVGAFNEDIRELQAEEWRGDASAPIENGLALGFSSIMPTSVGGFNCCEWGWIDSEGDLIAYGQFDKPIYKSISYTTFEPELYIELSNSIDATLIVSDSLNWEHNKMTGRSATSCHPISAIEGLQIALDQINGNTHNDLKGRDAIDAHPISSITDLQDALDGTVKTTGDQTVSGVKTHTHSIHSNQFASQYGDLAITYRNGIITIGGVLNVTIDPSTNNGRFTVDQGMKMYGDGSGLNVATADKAGVVKIGDGISITDGKISATESTARTWADVTASRALGQTFTNNTKKDIQFFVRSTRKTDTDQEFTMTIDGVEFGTVAFIHDSYPSQLTFISPMIAPNSKYRINGSTTTTLEKWMETS